MGFWKGLVAAWKEGVAQAHAESELKSKAESEPRSAPAGPAEPVPQATYEITGVARRARERNWRPPHAITNSTTYGDARFADPSVDAAAMKDALGGASGIWFGTCLGTGRFGKAGEPREVSYVGERHLLTVAPTGSGKGSCAIIPNIMMQNDLSIICIDPKGQNAAVTGRKRGFGGKPVYYLNPFRLHSGAPWNLPSHKFNPLAHLAIDHPNLVAEVASLSQALIVTESKTQPYFDNAARDLVKALILHAIATKGNKATLLDMRTWLGQPMTAPNDQPSLTKTIFEMTCSPYPFIREGAARFLGDARSINEVVQSASTQTEFLSDPCIAETLSGSDFGMIDFKIEPTTLYIMLPDTYLDAYSRFMRVITISALDGLRSRPGGVRTLVILDEFPRLGHMAAVENAFSLARGYNVQIWPFIQDLSQLKDIYDKRWESFMANAGVVQWFTPNDPFTAEYLSKRIGKTTIRTSSLNSTSTRNEGGGTGASVPAGPGTRNTISYNKSQSSTDSTSRTEGEAAADYLSPQDLYHFPDYYQIITLAGFKYPILCSREHYYEWDQIMDVVKQQCMPDPYHFSGEALAPVARPIPPPVASVPPPQPSSPPVAATRVPQPTVPQPAAPQPVPADASPNLKGLSMREKHERYWQNRGG
jgi:type IV secretion system protein VirD4